MGFKDTIEDLGRKMIGQGDEVRFKNDVLEYERTHRLGHDEAERNVLFDRMRNVELELSSNGIISSDSKDFDLLQAALNEVFGSKNQEQYSKDAADPAIFRSIAVPPSTLPEVNRVRGYYASNFGGKTPPFAVTKDSADNMKMIQALMTRFETDPRIAGAGSIESTLALHSDLGADLGKIFEAKKAVERHERLFGKDLAFEQTMANFKKTAQNSLTEMVWKAPVDYITTMAKKGLFMKSASGLLGSLMKETARFSGREAVAGTKLFGSSLKALGSLVKNKMIR